MMISPLFCSVLLLTEHLLSNNTQILSLGRLQRRQWADCPRVLTLTLSLSNSQWNSGLQLWLVRPFVLIHQTFGPMLSGLSCCEPLLVGWWQEEMWLHPESPRLAFSNHTLHFMEWPVLQLADKDPQLCWFYLASLAPQVGIDISIPNTAHESEAVRYDTVLKCCTETGKCEVHQIGFYLSSLILEMTNVPQGAL